MSNPADDYTAPQIHAEYEDNRLVACYGYVGMDYTAVATRDITEMRAQLARGTDRLRDALPTPPPRASWDEPTSEQETIHGMGKFDISFKVSFKLKRLPPISRAERVAASRRRWAAYS